MTVSAGGGTSITIEYKEFGVRLNFRPLVLGDGTIRLYASPEVSELDYASGTTVNGTSVPGASTTYMRRQGSLPCNCHW